MADQKRWFKVWTSLLIDMDNVSDHLVGKWTRLGCRTALVGNAGTVLFDDWEHVARFLKVTVEDAKSCLQSLPSVSFEEGENRHGKVAVTFKKWVHYQEDSTRNQRARASRAKRRGEKTREEEKRSTPLTPQDAQPTPIPKIEPPPPTGPLDCETCQRVLNHLNERTARTYNAPGRTGQQLHDRHVQFGEAACVQVIDVKVDDCQATGKGWEFVGPNVLFKAENFDTFRNQAPRVPVETDAERIFRRQLRGESGGSNG